VFLIIGWETRKSLWHVETYLPIISNSSPPEQLQEEDKWATV